MPLSSLTQSFNTLFIAARAAYATTDHIGHEKNAILATTPQTHGVYVIVKTPDEILYIGCAGKVDSNLNTTGQTIRRRLRGALTPYKFEDMQFLYHPTSAGVPPSGYGSNCDITDLTITCFQTPPHVAPIALESLLLQGYITQFGALPVANQKL